MIDLNTIISQALAAAVQQATAPLLERIAALEAQSADRHARLRVLEGALTDRVAALEDNKQLTAAAFVTYLDSQKWFWEKLRNFTGGALTERIAALEKRVFEDLGTIIEQEFIASMAVTDVVGHDTVKALTDRVAALESPSTQGIGVLLENLDNQEWFWHKIREFTGTVVEQAIENHTDFWDHNDFVTEDKLDDYVKTETFDSEVHDAVREVMEGATVSIRI